jgi:hypothetical protein
MKKLTFATIAASGLAAVTIGLAAPAVAAPSGSGSSHDTISIQPTSGETPYGTYQNEHKRQSNR